MPCNAQTGHRGRNLPVSHATPQETARHSQIECLLQPTMECQDLGCPFCNNLLLLHPMLSEGIILTFASLKRPG